MTSISKAILAINSKAEFSVVHEDVNRIHWFKGTSPIPVNEILAKQQELIAEHNTKQYQRDRAEAYPSIEEQLDMQYWDKVNGTDNWEQAINAVKVKFPKP